MNHNAIVAYLMKVIPETCCVHINFDNYGVFLGPGFHGYSGGVI